LVPGELSSLFSDHPTSRVYKITAENVNEDLIGYTVKYSRVLGFRLHGADWLIFSIQ